MKKKLEKMSDDEFFKLLDKKSAQIISRPLTNFHRKLFAATANLLNSNKNNITELDKKSQ